MSLVLSFRRDDPARVRFVMSPLWETMSALRVLLEPHRRAVPDAAAGGALLESLAEPASTHTLARRHGVAPSTVSEHLAVLYQAGLVTRRRRRHAVIYQQAPLGAELAQPRAPLSGPAQPRSRSR